MTLGLGTNLTDLLPTAKVTRVYKARGTNSPVALVGLKGWWSDLNRAFGSVSALELSRLNLQANRKLAVEPSRQIHTCHDVDDADDEPLETENPQTQHLRTGTK